MLLRRKKHTTDETKKTESVGKTAIKRTNIYIVIASVTCLTLFISAVLIGKRKTQPQSQTDNAEAVQDKKIIAKVPPDIEINPTNMEIGNVDINSSSEAVIDITIKDASAVISKINFDTDITSIKITESCIERKKMDIGEKCTVTLSYTPTEVENKTVILSVTWHGVDSEDEKEEKNKTINVSVSSKSEPNSNTVENTEQAQIDIPQQQEKEIKEEIIPHSTSSDTTPNSGDTNSETEEKEANTYEENEVNPPNTNEDTEEKDEEDKADDQPENTQNIDNSDCRKYAAKARRKNGEFLGWIQTSKKVMSPDCKNVIGILQDNGKIFKIGTQEIIGIGPRLDGTTNNLDDRALQEIPEGLRKPIFDTTDIEEMKTSFATAMEKRKAAKEGAEKTPKVDQIESARKGEEGVDPYRASDPLGIMKKGKNEFIPPSISDNAQISSFPKKNKYTLRENKAIPAVLNRAVKFFGDKGGGGEGTDVTETSDNCGGSGVRVSATVERNVYSDSGRTIVLPSGTVVYGCVIPPNSEDKTKMYERVKMTWDRFIRPDGAEFNLGSSVTTFSGDAQGQDGVPGKRDLGYMKRMLLEPILYSLLPIAVNMISPATQTIKNTYSEADASFGGLGSNTYKKIETSGELSSKEQAKAEIIENWRTVSQEIMANSLKNFQPPFTIPAGTRITIFVQKDLILRLTEKKSEMSGQGDPEGE